MIMVKVSASIMSADMAILGKEVDDVSRDGADRIHIDVIDGTFAPNLSFGANAVDVARRNSALDIEAHLMVSNEYFITNNLIPDVARQGASIIVVHPEAVIHLDKVLGQIRSLGKRAGIALNPSTHIHAIEHILPKLDHVLIMTVNPGFSGQKFLSHLVDKITSCRKMVDNSGFKIEIAVDGGVNKDTVGLIRAAGADIAVAGAAIFRNDNKGNYASAISELKNAA